MPIFERSPPANEWKGQEPVGIINPTSGIGKDRCIIKKGEKIGEKRHQTAGLRVLGGVPGVQHFFGGLCFGGEGSGAYAYVQHRMDV